MKLNSGFKRERKYGDHFRKPGIGVIGDAPWGTNFRQFYQTREDLVDILVPYLKAGLESNGFSKRVTCEHLSVIQRGLRGDLNEKC